MTEHLADASVLVPSIAKKSTPIPSGKQEVMKMCTDLGNDATVQGSAVATLSCKAFKTWMKQAGYEDIDEQNTKQIVVKLHKEQAVVKDNITFTPNWHITAMTDQMKSRCN